MNQNQVILMADVIQSGSHDATRLSRHLKSMISAANRVKSNGVISPLTVTLGDEFQGVCKSVEAGIKTILWLEHRLRTKPLSIDDSLNPYGLRYVLHEGIISTPLNSERAHGMLGPGLTKARQLLNHKERGQSRFQISIAEAKLSRQLQRAFRVMDELTQNYKAEDYVFIEMLLHEPDSERIGKKIGRHRTSIGRRRRSLQIGILQNIESLIIDLSETT